ncbi:hypothetical protein [Neobacillus dielmonensis]|uniref:hypothetical protein n=1 Tax=Neobacillus dielmonensis TaxID=1347369 RepID=UPI0005A7975D|nr:hypothetical protein [Neobacillus dielmonensis]
MWKKLFYGASKRFANDVSNIAANEMKKKIKETRPRPDFDDDTNQKERAAYLNRLRQILLDNQKMLATLIDIINGIKGSIMPPFDEEGLLEYSQLILDIQDIAYQKHTESHEINDIGDQLAEKTDDYSVYYKSMDVSLINAEIIDLTNNVYNSLLESELQYDDFLVDKLDSFIKMIIDSQVKVKEKYEELTEMNLVRIFDSGGQRTIDYNE